MSVPASGSDCAASDPTAEKSTSLSCCCSPVDSGDQSDCFRQMTDGSQLVDPHCPCLVRLSFPRCFSSTSSSSSTVVHDGSWQWRDQISALLSDQLVVHSKQLGLTQVRSGGSQLLHVVSGTRLMCVTVRTAPDSGSSAASPGSDFTSGTGRTRALLVYAAGSPAGSDAAEFSGQSGSGDVDSVTEQLTVLLTDCCCHSVSDVMASGDTPESGGNPSSPDESPGCVCSLHKQLLHLLATDCCGHQLYISWKRTGHQVVQKWLLLRLLAACCRRSPETHLQLVMNDGRELRSLLAADNSSSSVPSLSSSSSWPTSNSTPCLSHIDRLQLLSGSRCVDVTSVGKLFPRLLTLEVITRHRLDKQMQQHQSNGSVSVPPDEERCVCRYRVSGGSAVQLEHLRVALLDTVCSSALAAIRTCAKQLCTLQLIECRLKAPRSVCLPAVSGRVVGGASGSGRVVGGVNTSGRGRSFREIIQTVLRRKVVTLPNIQIRALSVRGRSCPSASLVNSNFPCLKRLCVFMSSDSAGWSQTESVPLDSVGKETSSQLWFPSLEWLRVDYSGCGGGEGGESEPLAILQRPLHRLVHYAQNFGRIGWLRLMRACPALRSVAFDPVLLVLPPPSASLARSSSGVQHVTVSWCDPETLERLTALTPALQRLQVVDPPVSDKNAWSALVDRLRKQDVHVELLW